MSDRNSQTPTVVFLSLGQLYIRHPEGEPTRFESPFALQAEERMERSRQANAWKGNAWNLNRAGFAQPEQQIEGRRAIRFSSVRNNPASSNEMLYLLDMGDVSGVFRYDLRQCFETRLVHRNAFPARDLACSETGEFAVAISQPDGCVGLAFSKTEGRHWNQIPAGDAINLAPSWVPGERSILFQSATIGRSENGAYLGVGPFAIEKLELKPDAESQQVADSHEFDLLSPRYDSQERLLYIRRPYEPQGHFSLWDQARDLLLFPYRLFLTLFAMLNFLSIMLRKEPLDTVGAQQRSDVLRQSHFISLQGRIIDTRKELAKGNDGNLVPGGWELVRRVGDEETKLASHVTCYDLCEDDSIVYSNGTRVIHLASDGTKTTLFHGKMISELTIISMSDD